jgi:hypothetical protein
VGLDAQADPLQAERDVSSFLFRKITVEFKMTLRL